MKKDIHPVYYNEAKIKCACGNTVSVGSAKQSINVEVCSACHPFYTGKGKILDTAGRIEKFKTRAAAKKEKTEKTPRKKKNSK